MEREIDKQEERELQEVEDKYNKLFQRMKEERYGFRCGTPRLEEEDFIKMKYDALRRENGIPPKWTKRKNI